MATIQASQADLSTVQVRMNNVEKNVERLATAVVGGVAVASMSAFDFALQQPHVAAGRKLVVEDTFRVPATKASRRAVLDYADAMATIGVGLDRGALSGGVAAEKYGAYAERLLASPFFQDQALRNPARWGSVVSLGAALFQEPAAHIPGPTFEPSAARARVEAELFVRSFPKESVACAAAQRDAEPLPGTDYHVKCDSTRRLLHGAASFTASALGNDGPS